MIPENERRRPRAAAAPVQNDVISPGFDGKTDVILYVIGRDFITDRNAAGNFTDPVGKSGKIGNGHKILKSWRRYGRGPFGKPPDLCNFAHHFTGWKVTAGAGFCPLTTLEMESLNPGQYIFPIAKAGRGQFIKITAVGRLFLWQHTAFTGTYTRPGLLRARRQGNLGFFRQGPKAHVRNKQGHLEDQRFAGIGSDDQIRGDGYIIHQWFAGKLRR